ncbi:MAG TPA: metalloregulator ArsR/SmtB family transcription factor [Dehalococcoidia bacterium]|nr:metalloregulator ArsR/SmtB family transcription factor [Dehalococcoidia bacterium]
MPAPNDQEVARYADLLAAIGAEPRLRIVRLLLAAHPKGMAAGDISAELDITPSTLSHHLDRLKREDVVRVRREGTSLWYTVNTEALERLLRFLYAECCTRSGVIDPERLLSPSASTRSPRPGQEG